MKYQPLNFYIKKAQTLKIKNSSDKKKISILSNFTLKGLADVLKVFSQEQHMEIEVYEAPFNQYKQEIINKNSDWYQFKSDLTFLILNFESLIGDELYRFYNYDEKKQQKIVEDTCDEIKYLIKKTTENYSGKLIISNFISPTYSPLGIYDSKLKYSLKFFVNKLNTSIQELILDIPNLFLLDMELFIQNLGRENAINEKLRFLADMKISPNSMVVLAAYLLKFLKPLFGKTRKCLVLDLDNTLWGGVIGEDGIDGIRLDTKPPGNAYLEFQKVLLELYDIGIILAINSKNNLNDVDEVFEKHPNMVLKKKHFALIQVNWDNKVNNMYSIAEALNIGLDSFVFWDDDPVNRDLIKKEIPEVLVVDVPEDPSNYSQTLRNIDDFNSFQITDEDRKKGQMYAEQNLRTELSNKFSDLTEFLTSLSMEVDVTKSNNFLVPRISQLTMKTNQFNLTTKRYSEEEIRNMMKDLNYIIKTFSVRDRFGDNGITGLYIVQKINSLKWIIDTFLLSCRVMGRDIEKLMIYDIIKEAKNAGIKELSGIYIPTKKNQMTRDLYQKNGFTQKSNNEFILEDLSKINYDLVQYIKIHHTK